MEFAFDAGTEDLREPLFDLIGSHVCPAEPVFHAQLGRLEDKWAWDSVPVIAQLRAEARGRGL